MTQWLDEVCDDGDSNHEFGACSPSCKCGDGFSMTKTTNGYWSLPEPEQEASTLKPYECLCEEVCGMRLFDTLRFSMLGIARSFAG